MLSEDTNFSDSKVGRDRAFAQRRGILMSLSRDRELYFQPKLVPTLVFSILTFGIGPLFQSVIRIDRWKRFESLELSTAARELLVIDPQDDTRGLVRLIDDDSIKSRSNKPSYLMLLISLVIVIHWLISIQSFRDFPLLIWNITSIDLHRSALTIASMGVGINLLTMLSAHERAVDRFYKSLNSWLISREKRPLRTGRSSSISPAFFLLAGLIALVTGFWWIMPSCMVAAAMSRYAARISSTHRPVLRELLIDQIESSSLKTEPRTK